MVFKCETCGMVAHTDDLSVIGRNCPAADFKEAHDMRPVPTPEVAPCRTCGTAVYLADRNPRGVAGGTGPNMADHWRHIEGNERYCERGNGAVAEPYDGGGPVAEALRQILAARGGEWAL